MINVMIIVSLIVILFTLGCEIYITVSIIKDVKEIKKNLKRDNLPKLVNHVYDDYDEKEIFGYTE